MVGGNNSAGFLLPVKLNSRRAETMFLVTILLYHPANKRLATTFPILLFTDQEYRKFVNERMLYYFIRCCWIAAIALYFFKLPILTRNWKTYTVRKIHFFACDIRFIEWKMSTFWSIQLMSEGISVYGTEFSEIFLTVHHQLAFL